MAIALMILTLTLVSCNGGTYSNPSSPSASPTEWRTLTISETGGTFTFADIGLYITAPPGAVPEGEVYNFQVRGFPPNIPLLPTGPVLVRLGTFEIVGDDVMFEQPVTIRFRLADSRSPGIMSKGYKLTTDQIWESYGNAPIWTDGMHATISTYGPGVYGSFEFIQLHVEARVSQMKGPVPLSVGFDAIITGGYPPYDVLWDFGDGSDSQGGHTVAHAYMDPGDYTCTVMVVDRDGNTETDWLHLTCYGISGPPWLP